MRQFSGLAEQILDLNELVSAGVDAIVLDPSDPGALDPVIKQAPEMGIVVVAADRAVSASEAYAVTNDQIAFGKLGAEWLIKRLSGKGDVVEMRGFDGAGLAVALDGLRKMDHPHVATIDLDVWDEADVPKLRSDYDTKLDRYYSDEISVNPFPIHLREQLLACKGPA